MAPLCFDVRDMCAALSDVKSILSKQHMATMAEPYPSSSKSLSTFQRSKDPFSRAPAIIPLCGPSLGCTQAMSWKLRPVSLRWINTDFFWESSDTGSL